MKNLTKTEERVIERANYTPACGKFNYNRTTGRYDIVNDVYIDRCRARIAKLMKEEGVDSAAELLRAWNLKERNEGRKALELFRASDSYKKVVKLPSFVRVDALPHSVDGKRLSTSYVKKYMNKQGRVPSRLEQVIKNASYYACDWGRLQKKNEGIKQFHCKGIRTEDNGKYGMKRVVWHYADCYVAVNKDVTKAYYKLSDGQTGLLSLTKSGAFVFRGNKYRPIRRSESPVLRAHHIRRAAEKVCRGPVHFAWDRTQKSAMFVDTTTGEQYHFQPDNAAACRSGFYEKTFLNAVSAFRKRRNEKARLARFEAAKAFMNANKERIFVSLEDSRRAGNCDFGTKNFVSRTLQIDPEKVGAVTVGFILEKRNDSYTQRACVAAAERFIQSHHISLMC